MDQNTRKTLTPMRIIPSFSIFIPASLILGLETYYLIPYLSRKTGQEPVLFWFLVAGLGMFLPLVILALFIIKSEGYQLNLTTWRERLRFRKMTRTDWLWSLGAFVAIGLGSTIVMKGLEFAMGEFDHSPPFMTFEPLTPGRYWFLLAWLPYWILNILGEEILWRGVMLPRQEVALGRFAWMIHAVGWGIFHIAFGWQLLLTLIPILLILPYVVQRRQNSWIGVIIHAGLNGPSFIAIALGVL